MMLRFLILLRVPMVKSLIYLRGEAVGDYSFSLREIKKVADAKPIVINPAIGVTIHQPQARKGKING